MNKKRVSAHLAPLHLMRCRQALNVREVCSCALGNPSISSCGLSHDSNLKQDGRSSPNEELKKGGSGLLNVILPLPLDEPLTYLIGPDTDVPNMGARVVVPVGKRHMVGIAWDYPSTPPSGVELKQIIRTLDKASLLPVDLLKVLSWAASYYLYPLGMAIKDALPPGLLSARQKGIEKILSTRSGISSAEVPHYDDWEKGKDLIQLTPHQKKALATISDGLEKRIFSPIVLFGVTGSGKTEVYIQAAKMCLELGRQVLVLVPEIAMTAQTVGRFTNRFGDTVTILHSGLTEAQRRQQWQRIRRGEGKLVIGTRSAVFAPLEDPGLIIVDEEHDQSYKQETRFRYQARDIAVVRAREHKSVVVLGSATPSVVSLWNVKTERYTLVSLPERVGSNPLPRIEIIDMRKRPGRKKGRRAETIVKDSEKKPDSLPFWLSRELKEALEHTLQKGRQALLFLNRRGFASYNFCLECGYVFKCKNCEVSLTFHKARGTSKKSGQLICHYCGYSIPAMPLCPKCKGQAVKATGFGTERVAEDLMGLFPNATVERLDRDAASSRQRIEGILKAFHHRQIDILVGTQMISKGHDFPGLTLVGILWADLSLNFPEYHAAEKTFQLLTQVAGRAGRRDVTGKVLIQTYLPDHYTLRSVRSYDLKGFYEKEWLLRKRLAYPPFGKLAVLRFSGRNKTTLAETVKKVSIVIKKIATNIGGVGVLGPAPAPMARLKSLYRYQLLLKSSTTERLRGTLSMFLKTELKNCLPSSVRVEIDIDPFSLL